MHSNQNLHVHVLYTSNYIIYCLDVNWRIGYHINKTKKPKELTLGSHFLVGTYLSAILFSVQQADKFLPPEKRTSQN